MMDPELKAYLEDMRHDLKQEILDSRLHAERQNQETRQDMMTHAERLNQETRQDMMAHAERLNQETRLLIEVVRDDVRGIADGVIQINTRLDRLEQSVDERFQQHDQRLMRLESAERSRGQA